MAGLMRSMQISKTRLIISRKCNDTSDDLFYSSSHSLLYITLIIVRILLSSVAILSAKHFAAISYKNVDVSLFFFFLEK